VQTVSRATNPLYWSLIRKFADRTGVPVVLNTSFNLKGDPIVNTTKDAIQTFYASGLDALIIGPFCIDKSPPPTVDSVLWRRERRAPVANGAETIGIIATPGD
jgi:hypothetical protein